MVVLGIFLVTTRMSSFKRTFRDGCILPAVITFPKSNQMLLGNFAGSDLLLHLSM